MARVKQRGGKKAPGGASTRGRQVAKEKNKHKFVLGGNAADKKLPTVVRKREASCPRGIAYSFIHRKITFRADPPPGYTFVPAGNPELTTALKEFARRGDHKIFAVTVRPIQYCAPGPLLTFQTTPHATRHELSREVHRIGFHFPTSVVSQVCAHYGIRLTRAGKVIDESKDDKLFMKVYQNQSGQRPVDEKDQVTINTDAKQTIKDLFPNIPDKDLFQIIKTAFQLGDNRVGTANEIPLVRRAQLSVVAHIRHVYTNYDKLLRFLPYNEARHKVEQDTLLKLVEWRGDEDTVDEATQRAADDLLREVIVISDEEDSETDSDDGDQVPQNDVHIEELPSTSYAMGLGTAASPPFENQREGEAQDYHTFPRVIRSYRPNDVEIAQRDQSRYAVWNRAKQDYRSSIAQRPATVLERIYEPEPPASRVLVPLDPPTYTPSQIVQSQPPPSALKRTDYEVRVVPGIIHFPPLQGYSSRADQSFSHNRFASKTRRLILEMQMGHCMNESILGHTKPFQRPCNDLLNAHRQ